MAAFCEENGHFDIWFTSIHSGKIYQGPEKKPCQWPKPVETAVPSITVKKQQVALNSIKVVTLSTIKYYGMGYLYL